MTTDDEPTNHDDDDLPSVSLPPALIAAMDLGDDEDPDAPGVLPDLTVPDDED